MKNPLNVRNPEIFEEICKQLRSGALLDDLDSQEYMRGIFQSITERDNAPALQALFDAGLPLNYVMPEYVMKNVASFALVNLAGKCMELLQKNNFNFCAPDCLIDGANYFLYSISRGSLHFTKMFAEELIRRDNHYSSHFQINALDGYDKTALHLAIEQYEESVFDYVLSLPLDPEFYYQSDDLTAPEDGVNPLVYCLHINRWDYASKIIHRFDTIEHYTKLQDNLTLLDTPDFHMVENKDRAKELVQTLLHIRLEQKMLNEYVARVGENHKTIEGSLALLGKSDTDNIITDNLKDQKSKKYKI